MNTRLSVAAGHFGTIYGTLTKRKTKQRCIRRDYYISRQADETLAGRSRNIRESTDLLRHQRGRGARCLVK